MLPLPFPVATTYAPTAMELVKTLPSKLVGPAKKLLEGLPEEVVMVAIAQCVWRRWVMTHPFRKGTHDL